MHISHSKITKSSFKFNFTGNTKLKMLVLNTICPHPQRGNKTHGNQLKVPCKCITFHLMVDFYILDFEYESETLLFKNNNRDSLI